MKLHITEPLLDLVLGVAGNLVSPLSSRHTTETIIVTIKEVNKFSAQATTLNSAQPSSLVCHTLLKFY